MVSIVSVFKRYMIVPDKDKAHAKLSASGSERWMNCLGSVRESEGYDQDDTDAGIRGTNTHTLIQFIHENKNWAELLRSKKSRRFKQFLGFDEEMLRNAMFAVDFVKDEVKRLYAEHGNRPDVYIEKKVKLQGVGYGTSDTIIFQHFGLLHVIDYKNGRFKVSPIENSQGLYYAVAAADLVGWDFSHVRITIVQPNAAGEPKIRSWDTTPERLKRARFEFRERAKLTRDPEAPLVPNSKYCWFCPANPKNGGKCSALREQMEAKVINRFKKPGLTYTRFEDITLEDFTDIF